jgi:glycerol-3-phosphate acyltransferase PlsY
MSTTVVLTLLAYFIGSIAFAVIVSRAFGLPDPRSYGSHNPGATNVLRTGRKAAALLTLFGDGAKGCIAVTIAGRFAEADLHALTIAASAVAVMIGHMYPVFFRFRGGKGVATALGALLGLNVYLALGAAATWIIIVVFFRISSLAALIAALFAPFFALILYNPRHAYFIAVTMMSALLIWRHRANIRNLIAGTEDRVGQR